MSAPDLRAWIRLAAAWWCAAAAPALAGLPYVKKATPPETLAASVAAYRAAIPKSGDWFVLGPLDPDQQPLDPARPVNLKDTLRGKGGAKVGWTRIWKVMDRHRPHDMNQFVKPRYARPCSVYVWHEMTSASAHAWDVKIVFSHRIRVWLNGKLLGERTNKRSYYSAFRVSLPLKRGRNELLYWVDTHPRFRRVLSCLYPARSEDDARRYALARIKKDFPDSPPRLIEEYDQLQRERLGAAWKDLRYRYSRKAIAAQTRRRAALVFETDRDPLDIAARRARALLADLLARPDAPDLHEEAQRLRALEAEARRAPATALAARWRLFVRLCRLRRRIAFRNPLLDFDRIVFLTHALARRSHMCDQYFGFNARPGGGVFVLENWRSDHPTVRNLLADSVVQNGRLRGRRLRPGSFISLELSYDAKTLLFAYTEAASSRPVWTPPTCYHIFKVNLDGSGLTQLTDGPWNDFDPCWLPDGRIAFISERRGGYGRCHGRPVPTYTLHVMNADGSGLRAISLHETNEWQPSVANDGRICYTRWDYVDRDSDIAHHIWLTFPDGRDPRSFHGNYPRVREARPWMEMSIRAIPDSPRYVAVAAPHHGQAFGSLVLIDQRLRDDDAMSQLQRLTPDAPFPEAERWRGGWVYGSPWPLSEDYFLAVYDPDGRRHGVYLIDSFGNREQLYRDPSLPCLDPIPLRPRPRPPVIPCAAESPGRGAVGEVVIVNVYDSDFQWPKGVKVAALRVVQIFPKSTPYSDRPRIGVAAQSLARGVLGVAPVEADGSARFLCPADVPIYFQALDAAGRAVQSMRSDTYVRPGARLTCLGCHEPKNRAPAGGRPVPLALRRPASKLQPEPDGSYPLSFPRLVQPVLDKRCAGCHRKHPKKAPDLSAADSGSNGWSKAYRALAPRGFFLSGGNGAIRSRRSGGARSVPGHVGAYASPLYRLLAKGHHDVKLTPEEWRRLTVWLDCNTNFYGAYRECDKQRAGRVVKPKVF